MTLEHIIDMIQGTGLDINKGIEYLKLDEKEDTDGIKVRYVRQALTIPFGRKWEE